MPNPRIATGNAAGYTNTRGWFVGSFLNPDTDGARVTDNVEVKWSLHSPGDQRPDIAPGNNTVTLTILLAGRFEQIFPGEDPETVQLEKMGDFALFGPDVPHTWRALAESVMLTVRWRPEPTPDGMEVSDDG